MRRSLLVPHALFASALLLGTTCLATITCADPVKVSVRDEKATAAAEITLPVDPTPRLNFSQGNMTVSIRDAQNRSLHLSHMVSFMIDGQVYQQGLLPGGRFEKANQALPPVRGKARHGFETVYRAGDLRFTLIAELVPSKARKGIAKRRLDAMRLRYEVENLGQRPRKVAMRVYMDVYIISNDGALFAAPTMPKQILNGVELKGKTLPPYVQLLQQPNLANPGFVAHLTLDLGGAGEKAERVVLTHHGNGLGGWDMPPRGSNGDSALGVFWENKELKPGTKRVMAYAYGEGRAEQAGHEGRFDVRLGGSFEPGKLFTITTTVHDPYPGQALTLDLPPGLELVEGRAIQPVPAPSGERAESILMWKARVRTLGTYPLRIRCNSGVTQTKTLTIEQAIAKE